MRSHLSCMLHTIARRYVRWLNTYTCSSIRTCLMNLLFNRAGITPKVLRDFVWCFRPEWCGPHPRNPSAKWRPMDIFQRIASAWRGRCTSGNSYPRTARGNTAGGWPISSPASRRDSDLFQLHLPSQRRAEDHLYPALVRGAAVQVCGREVLGFRWVRPVEVASVLTHKEDRDLAIRIMSAISDLWNLSLESQHLLSSLSLSWAHLTCFSGMIDW